MASALQSYWRRKNVFSEPSVMASELRSLNDFPDEILLKILSHFGPEDLCLIIAKVCEKWNVLAKDMIFWKTLSYNCGRSSDISRIAEVRCTTLFGCRTNWLMNFAPSGVLKVQIVKSILEIRPLHPEVRLVSRGKGCRVPHRSADYLVHCLPYFPLPSISLNITSFS
jgi:hypothetical protein